MKVEQAQRRITVYLCIAEPLLQAGARVALQQAAGIDVVEGDRAALPMAVDVIVSDDAQAQCVAAAMSGWDYRGRLKPARVLAIAAIAREHAVRRALLSGVHGFVLTSSPLQELVRAVRALSRGETYLCPQVACQLSGVGEHIVLTGREDEVLRLLAQGLCNKLIARHLEIAAGTVKTHVKAIMAKLNASSRTEAASIATARGLVQIPVFSAGRVCAGAGVAPGRYHFRYQAPLKNY